MLTAACSALSGHIFQRRSDAVAVAGTSSALPLCTLQVEAKYAVKEETEEKESAEDDAAAAEAEQPKA